MDTKTCTKCGETKVLDSFACQKTGKMGVTAACKVCRNERQKELRAANPERTKAFKKKYYWENPELYRQRAKAYAKDNAEKIKQRRLARREQDNERWRRYYQEHKDRELARGKRWRVDSPEKYKARMKRSADLMTSSGTRRTDEWREKHRAWYYKRHDDNKAKARGYGRKQRESLSDGYVVHTITNKSVLHADDVRGLIPLKRVQLKISRAVKVLNNTIKEKSYAR